MIKDVLGATHDFTDEEFAAAVVRYEAFCKEHPGDLSDFTLGDLTGYEHGLRFVMGTYAKWTWARFFGLEVTPPELLPPEYLEKLRAAAVGIA